MRAWILVALTCFALNQAEAQLSCYFELTTAFDLMPMQNVTQCGPGYICSKLVTEFDSSYGIPLGFELGSCREINSCNQPCDEYFNANIEQAGGGISLLGLELTSCEQVCCDQDLCNTGDIADITPAVIPTTVAMTTTSGGPPPGNYHPQYMVILTASLLLFNAFVMQKY